MFGLAASLACVTLLPPNRWPEATALAATLNWAATVIAAYTPSPLPGTPTAVPLEVLPTDIGPITPVAETPLPVDTPQGATPVPTFAAPPTDPPGLYAVQPGDTLPALALRFRVEPAALLRDNPGLPLTQTIGAGPWLTLPANAHLGGYEAKLLPDSEVIHSPSAASFDVRGFVLSQPGFLAAYTEVVTATLPPQPGWQIVLDAARRYSLHPRLLLALLEHQSGALSNPAADAYVQAHALGVDAPSLEPGLSHQLGWAGNQLNYGYYGWRNGGALSFSLADGAFRAANGRLNAGSFTVARLLGLMYRTEGFNRAVSPDGLMATYARLFGDPWAQAEAVLIPGGLTQPEMQLPFEPGRSWAFTGGPHAPWGRTLPWAALDFGPPAEQPGCAASPEWVTAVRDGVVTTSEAGIVELDVGGGWSVFYLHVATSDRIPAGTTVRAGDRLGHPSCEGGRATAAHLHLARKYQGEWVPADGYAPFILSGWAAHFGGSAYYGSLTRGDQIVEACACANAATRLEIEP
jgi:murein DD-endopeptidase MepM/ murein hydrolase activator NlpD